MSKLNKLNNDLYITILFNKHPVKMSYNGFNFMGYMKDGWFYVVYEGKGKRVKFAERVEVGGVVMLPTLEKKINECFFKLYKRLEAKLFSFKIQRLMFFKKLKGLKIEKITNNTTTQGV